MKKFFSICVLLYSINIKAQFQYDIYKLDIKTGVTSKITSISNSGEWNASWSNNGKRIAHDVAGPGTQTIYVTDLQSGASAQLTGAEGGNDAAWSPDGSKIAFDIWEDFYQIGWFTQNIYTVPANGGARSLVRLNAHHASWNPKGNKVAFDDNYGYIAATIHSLKFRL
jgi:Periplasmic component of the Tol biopolymer transport system